MKSKYTFNEIEEFLDKTSKLKISNVYIQDLLTSGKSIGTIKVDDTSYNLLAPDDYLPLSGGVIKGSLEKRLPTENATQNYILFTRHNGTAQGYLGFNGVDNPIYIPSAANAIYTLLHEGNYKSFLDYAYLRVDGANVLKAPLVSTSSYLTLNGCSLYAKDGSTADWRVTTKDWTTEYRLLHSDNYESIVGNKFLKLSGGTLSKNAETLRLHSPEETNGSTFIKFTTSSKDTIQGYIGYSSSGFMFIQRGEGGLSGTQVVGLDNNGLFAWKDNAAKYFINEGNFNYYGTTIASGTWNIGINGRAAGFTTEYVNNLDNASENKFFHSGFQATNRPSSHNYATGLTLLNNELKYAYQLALDTYGNAYVRYKNTTAWQGWKTVAFTDSVVAGANKLVTTSGTEVALAENGGVVFPYTTSSLIDGLDSVGVHIKRDFAANTLAMGGLAITNFENKGTIFFGSSSGLLVYNYVNDAYSSVFRINNHGNVTIGSSDLAGTYSYSPKLFVDGYVAIPNGGAICTLNASGGNYANLIQLSSENVFYVGGSMAHLGYDTIIRGNNIAFQYGSNHTISMFINSSGNVTIGANDLASTSNKLYVQGHALIEGELFGANTADSSVLGWRLFANADATYLQAGKVTGAQNGNLYLTGLYGATLSRFIVYSDSSEMKGRLLVNGATDDGTTALQVKGDIVIPNYTAYKAYDTNGGKMNLMYLDTSNRLRVYNDTMSFTPQAKVGIGTATPDEKLHVVGNLHVTGNIIADGQVSSGQSIIFVDANGNNHILSWDDTAGGLKIDDKIITVN